MTHTRRDSFTSSAEVNSTATDVSYMPKPGREVASARWITVEPILLLGSMSSSGLLATRLQYLRARIAQDNFNVSTDYGENVSLACSAAVINSSSYIIQQEIQVQLSLYSLILNVLSTFPAIFMTIVIGSLSDQVGRRIGLVLPLVGLAVQCALHVAIFYAHLPLWVCYIADTLQGVTGGYGLILSTASAYIADITHNENRVFRIVIVEGAMVLGMGAIQPITSVVIQYFGMGVAFCTALGVVLPGLAYAALPWTTPETLLEGGEKETLGQYLKDTFCGIHRLLAVNTNHRRAKIGLLCLAELFLNTCMNGLAITTTYGLGPPFCWGPDLVGYFNLAASFMPVIGVTVAVKVLGFCIPDMWMVHCGTAFLVASSIAMALAPCTIYLFIGIIPYSIGALVSPVLKGILSKVVDEHEQGSIFALAGCIVNFAQFIGPLMSNAIYAATVSNFPPLVFYVFAGLLVMPTLINGIVQRLGVEVKAGYTRLPSRVDNDE